jgi:hypothetical protein
MSKPFGHARRAVATGVLVATLALGLAPVAFADDWGRDRAAAAARSELDPAIRTAVAARAAEATVPAPAPVAPTVSAAGGEGFAWGAAALGLGAGVAAMCALLGCVTLVRSHGRLRSV